MNRFFTLLLASSCLSAVGQCDEVFISEYIEGFSNNKALEIFNPTNAVVDLSDYQLERYSNGAATLFANEVVPLSGLLAPQDVVVCVLDKQDPAGVDFEAPVWTDLAEAADLWLCPVFDINSMMYFNGNDAIVLRKIPTNATVDVFGKVGEDPGQQGWAEKTQNHTLIRKPTVLIGDTVASDQFLVVDEWIDIPWTNDETGSTLDSVFVNIGFHNCNCLPASCNNPEACNYTEGSVDDSNCLFLDQCGVCGGPGIVFGDCDCDGNQLDAAGVCGGDCLADENGNGVCDNSEVYGCTYELAENYASEATYDDGSCTFPCEGVVNTNVFDWDGDYVVTVTDFLMMLSVYGDTDVDLDGVWDSGDDCVDTNACNYANDPSEPCTYIDILGVCGGGCEADEDNDGICDDVDTCIGIEDECGVCNGPGPTEVVIEDITILYDSVYAENIDTWFVYELGADTTFSYTCAPFFGDCGDPVSYQGYDYATVLIGDQCWFAENLRNENYDNGDAIPAGLSDSEWSSTTSGATAVYGEGSSTCSTGTPDGDACDEVWSLNEYGRLYNWYAVDDARGLCPSGWHVPTDEEWTVMTDGLGGASVAGGEMKTTYGWNTGSNGTNSSGFSGLPGGYRIFNGNFSNAGYYGSWWSSSPNGSYAWYRGLDYGNESVDRDDTNQRFGFSVRCVRDAE